MVSEVSMCGHLALLFGPVVVCVMAGIMVKAFSLHSDSEVKREGTEVAIVF